MNYILIYGNPRDGFRFVGPFAERDDAVVYLEMEVYQENIWIAQLDAPAVDEEEPK
jgi:hypothetical protein